MGCYIIFRGEPEKSTAPSILIVDKSKKIIDSLISEIEIRESIIDSLENKRTSIIKEKIKEINQVRSLPTTEGVEFLKKNLEEYEKEY